MSGPLNQLDQKRIVRFLAEEANVSVDNVATIYEQERAALARGAHVTRYIDIFAIRSVQKILRNRAPVIGAGSPVAGRTQRAASKAKSTVALMSFTPAPPS